MSKFDGLLMFWVNLPLDESDAIHSKESKFVMGVKIKARDDSKRNASPDCYFSLGNPCIVEK